MAGLKSKSARTIAIKVLNQCDPERNYAGPILNKLLHETDQKQRATDLVLGTIRNRRAIDTVISTFSGRPLERIPDKLLNIIRIGTYELIYSPETGQYSVINEAVENAKAFTGTKLVPAKTGKQVGFVNAVLRQITRHITNRRVELSQTNPKHTLYQTPATGCEFDSDFLPDPESSLADYLSIAFSLPKWIITNWLSEFGEEPTRQICFASNRKPSIYLRPNSLKTTTQNLAEKFQQADIDFEIVPHITPAKPVLSNVEGAGVRKGNDIENDDIVDFCFHRNDKRDESMIKVKSPRTITELPGFAEGLFTVQDISASQAVRILKPLPNWTILDLCAAPGVKTTQLAEATGDSAKIIATDIDAERLKKVRENTTRLGINSVDIVSYEELLDFKFKIPNSKFDCVLLDVPCSNTGVLARRIEARYRIKPRAIKELAKTQSELLNTAAQMLKPHGKICYSTCSIQKEENNDLIRDFLQKNRSFELESEELILPSAESRTNWPSVKPPKPRALDYHSRSPIGAGDHDGGYTAILTAT
ncbi:MAG: transcription antitermination factor NusB [Sedimentisphaerales bacterium]